MVPIRYVSGTYPSLATLAYAVQGYHPHRLRLDLPGNASRSCSALSAMDLKSLSAYAFLHQDAKCHVSKKPLVSFGRFDHSAHAQHWMRLIWRVESLMLAFELKPRGHLG